MLVFFLILFFLFTHTEPKAEESFDPLLVEQNNIHHKIIKEVLGGIRS